MESIADIPIQLPRLGDLKNLGQLPALKVFEVTQGRWLSRNVSNGFLDLENITSREIPKIHKTESSVPLRPSWTGSWPRFSRSLEHGSSVGMPAMDSSTSKT